MRVAVAAAVLAVAAMARAAGPELVEQSPQGIAVAGAQTADAGAPAAVVYNPAALSFQRGLTLQAGGAAVVQRASATLGGVSSDGSGAAGVPAIFAAQRVSARFAVGLGVYAPFSWTSSWPAAFSAASQGLGSSWRATDISPAVAVRFLPRIALGLALDVVPTSLSLRRGVTDGNYEGVRQLDASGTGIGGHAGILVQLVRRRLDAAIGYRSAMRIGLGGTARTVAPPEATGMLSPLADARATLPAPHAFTFAVAGRPIAPLLFTVDVRLALWHELSSLDFTLVDKSGLGLPPANDTTPLGFRDTVGVRAGAQLALWRDGDGDARVTVRLGGGFEQSPAPAAMPSPLFADGDRGLVSGGLGARLGSFSVDVGYAALIARDGGAYQKVTHVIGAAATLRLPDAGYHVDEPDYKY